MRRLFGKAFVDGAIRDGVLVTIDGPAFADVELAAAAPSDAERVDGVMVPGFVDLHVHGGDGADFMDGDVEAVARVLAFHARHGTTALAATTLSSTAADLRRAVSAISAAAAARLRGAAIEALHLEGPYINASRSGAQDRASIRPPDIAELEDLMGLVHPRRVIVTFAPEIEGAELMVTELRERAIFSIGHTAAGYGEAVSALEWGAARFTHLFNAMTPLGHREPGVVGAALLSTDATAELIADGVHIHPAVLRLATTVMKGRVTLVTDAMRACGLAAGNYKLYGYDVTVDGGAARLADGTLAGSVLTMDRAVRNMVELAGVPLDEVIPLATEVPARVIGLANRKGRIAVNLDADLVVLSEKLEVTRVFARGEELETG